MAGATHATHFAFLTQLEAERRRTAQAYASWQASERRAIHFERQARLLQERTSGALKDRGQLAGALDASIRTLGSVQSEIACEKHRQARSFFEGEAVGSLARGSALSVFGQQKNNLLDDLHMLHKKLHDLP